MLESGEAGFALGADGDDASGDGHFVALGRNGWYAFGLGSAVEDFCGRFFPLGADFGDGVRVGVGRGGEAVGIGRLAERFDGLEFFLAQGEEIALKFGIEHGVSFWCGGSFDATVSIAFSLGG